MTELAGFEENLRESVMEDAETALYGGQGNIAFQFLQAANENFEEYASRNDYDLDSIIESGQVTDTQRSANRVSVTIEWTSGLTGIYEWGVSPHTISGNPFLHFYYDRIDQWVKTEEVNWGSETGGIPESRAIRGALNQIRLQETGSVTL